MERSDETRLTNLESTIMHLQHDVESLSETLLLHQKTMGELQKALDKLSSTIENLDGDEARDPQDERPPHY